MRRSSLALACAVALISVGCRSERPVAAAPKPTWPSAMLGLPSHSPTSPSTPKNGDGNGGSSQESGDGGSGGSNGSNDGDSGGGGSNSNRADVERSVRIVCTDLTDLLHKSADGRLSSAILTRYVNKWHNLNFKTSAHYISEEVQFLWDDIYLTPPSATGLQFAKDARLMGCDCNRAGFHVPYVS